MLGPTFILPSCTPPHMYTLDLSYLGALLKSIVATIYPPTTTTTNTVSVITLLTHTDTHTHQHAQQTPKMLCACRETVPHKHPHALRNL